MSRTRALPSSAAQWSEFTKWCAQRRLKPLPAHPWTIAAYLRWIDRRADAATAHAALDAISRQHLLKTLRVPTRHALVARTLEMIDRRDVVRSQHAALFDEQDMLAASPPSAPPVEEDEADVHDPAQAQAKPWRRMLSTQPPLKRARPPLKGATKG